MSTNQSLLIIDSDPKNLRIFQQYFSGEQFQVDEASSDQAALDKMSQSVYNAVLSEISGPQIDGFKILEHLHRQAQTRTAVIFITQKSDVWNRVKSFKMGAKDYIVKPVHVKEIGARVRMILNRLQRRQTLHRHEQPFSGRLEDLSLAELIEVLSLEKRSGILELRNENALSGRVYFRDGQVTQATTTSLQAEEALYKMMSWQKGRFAMRFMPVEDTDQIGVSNMGLLLQGATRMEQREELLRQLPSLDAVLVTTDNFKRIVARKNLASDLDYFISLFDGQRSLGRIVDESIYDEITTLSRILKLYQLGFLNALRDYTTQPQEPEIIPTTTPLSETVTADEPEIVFPEETESYRTLDTHASTMQEDILDTLDEEDVTPEERAQEPELEDETQMVVQHDFADDSISELLTRDFSKWDSGYEKDLFYELRASAEEKSGLPTTTPLQHGSEDSQLLFPTLEMLEHEHPADALLTLKTGPSFPEMDHEEPPPPPKQPPVLHPAVDRPSNRFQNAYGHILILASDDRMRLQLVSSLVGPNVQNQRLGHPDWSDLVLGTAEFKGGHLLNIISVSVSKEFTGLMDYFARSMFGYILMIDRLPVPWTYYRYLLKTLQHSYSVPSIVLVPAQISLDANMSELDWRERLDLRNQQMLATHVEFESMTCKRIIFKLFENYYRDQVVLRKKNKMRPIGV
jgi:DNA-binding response OmpR family regulator